VEKTSPSKESVKEKNVFSKEERQTPPKDQAITTLYLGNLGTNNRLVVTEADLRGYFYQFGEIIQINIMPAKACAFLQFARRDQAERAFSRTTDLCLNGRYVLVGWARREPKPKGLNHRNYQANYSNHHRRREKMEEDNPNKVPLGKKRFDEKPQVKKWTARAEEAYYTSSGSDGENEVDDPIPPEFERPISPPPGFERKISSPPGYAEMMTPPGYEKKDQVTDCPAVNGPPSDEKSIPMSNGGVPAPKRTGGFGTSRRG